MPDSVTVSPASQLPVTASASVWRPAGEPASATRTRLTTESVVEVIVDHPPPWATAVRACSAIVAPEAVAMAREPEALLISSASFFATFAGTY